MFSATAWYEELDTLQKVELNLFSVSQMQKWTLHLVQHVWYFDTKLNLFYFIPSKEG